MKSECSEHEKKIAAYCLGDLAGAEKQALEAHLALCSHCRSEQKAYIQTVGQLASVGDEEIPHHFFVYPEERISNPLKLFRQMTVGWQTALVCAAVLTFCVAVAAVSRLQIRSDSVGWAISFGKSEVDTAALTKTILEAAEKKDREAGAAWVNELRKEISLYSETLSKQQKLQLTAALAQMDTRLTGKIRNSEGQVRDDTRLLVSDMYRTVSQQRAHDLETINLRLDSTDASNAIKSRQTNEILGTLLQVADLKLR